MMRVPDKVGNKKAKQDRKKCEKFVWIESENCILFLRDYRTIFGQGAIVKTNIYYLK